MSSELAMASDPVPGIMLVLGVEMPVATSIHTVDEAGAVGDYAGTNGDAGAVNEAGTINDDGSSSKQAGTVGEARVVLGRHWSMVSCLIGKKILNYLV